MLNYKEDVTRLRRLRVGWQCELASGERVMAVKVLDRFRTESRKYDAMPCMDCALCGRCYDATKNRAKPLYSAACFSITRPDDQSVYFMRIRQ